MRRGDIVTVSAPGDYGNPRPAVIVQSDRLGETDSVLVCLMTSTLQAAPIHRLPVQPAPDNGLRVTSQVMVDKIVVLPLAKCGAVIGRLDAGSVVALNAMLTIVLGLAD